MTNAQWLYFKINPDFKGGHLPANRELVGMRTGYPESEQYEIFRYPDTTTIFGGLFHKSYNTYDEARDGDYYEGGEA